MFENPILLEMLMKQRQEELALHNQVILRNIEMMRMHPQKTGRMNDAILLLADLLIMVGTQLKRHWSIEGDETMDHFASSLNGK